MPKKKDLEEIFIKELKKKHLGYIGRVFDMGEVVILADYMFGDTMVIFMDKTDELKTHKLNTFKTLFPKYDILLVTKNPALFLKQKWFSEIYDGKSFDELIKKLKRVLNKKTL